MSLNEKIRVIQSLPVRGKGKKTPIVARMKEMMVILNVMKIDVSLFKTGEGKDAFKSHANHSKTGKPNPSQSEG
ncbi:MAG: hypothetical protein NZ805_06840 [Armatimonadetes bacterium]|nr:hypothetical protein [Armatimonadota bacterium]MDW8028429.1 hypothetical protein [Armatimonadota bacterium]